MPSNAARINLDAVREHLAAAHDSVNSLKTGRLVPLAPLMAVLTDLEHLLIAVEVAHVALRTIAARAPTTVPPLPVDAAASDPGGLVANLAGVTTHALAAERRLTAEIAGTGLVTTMPAPDDADERVSRIAGLAIAIARLKRATVDVRDEVQTLTNSIRGDAGRDERGE